MDGTTLCPHCNTRFKIAEAQLALREGKVRCGQCLQAFDAQPSFVPAAQSASEPLIPEPSNEPESSQPDLVLTSPKTQQAKRRMVNLLASIFSLLLLIILISQATYFFRIDLAARYPNIKPVLIAYCHLLRCEVSLPQQAESMTIEASDLEAVPEHDEQIILNALLRNRAPYAQTFPYLELTLNDNQDKPLARRIFHPEHYLPRTENEQAGLLGNHEVAIKLPLNIHDLKATGYRLVLFYPNT
jgi:predicted Zn finger-like uncharacterized protein